MSYFEDRKAEIEASRDLRRRVVISRRYVTKETTRHGKQVYYLRKGKEPRVRLPDPDEVGEIVFSKAYQLALKGEAVGRGLERPRIPNYVVGVGKPGYVYFLKMGDAIKIGFSANVGSRLKSIQTACPEPAEILKVIPGSDNTERYFHEHFARYRMSGEWFRLEGDLCTFLAVQVS